MIPIRRHLNCTTTLGLLLLAESACSAPLDPNAFASLGTLNLSSGSLTFNTSTLSVSGGFSGTGVLHSQGAGLPEIAVFTFDELSIDSGVTLNLTGSRPMALLSKGNVMIEKFININGSIPGGGSVGGLARLGGGSGGNGHATSDPQPGNGSGGGGISPCCDPGGYGGGGGGFGGDGGDGGGPNPLFIAPGGTAYGDLASALIGGSGGGGGVKLSQLSANGGGGGGGGGAIEIGALGTVYVAMISAQGAAGGDVISTSGGGGGGSGGAVLLHGQTVIVPAGITVDGGDGGLSGGNMSSSGGGGGGGGRILVKAQMLSFADFPFTASVIGGQHGANSAPVQPGISGKSGIAVLEAITTIIPTGHLAQVQADGSLASDAAGVPWSLRTDRLRLDSGSIAVALVPVASAHDIDLNGGFVATALGWTMTGNAQISGFGQLSGALAGGATNQIAASGGVLTLGDANNTSGFSYGGTIDIDAGSTLNLLDADAAELGAVTTLSSGGRINSLNGIQLGPGETLTANAVAEIGGEFTNQGTVHGPAAVGDFLTFTDDVDGAGNYTGNVLFSDAFSPGDSAASVSLENVTFDSSASILIELGGRDPGVNHDQLIITGDSTINGATLNVTLIESFTPSFGDQFQVFSLASPLSGAGFSELDLPNLDAGLEWETDSLLTTGILTVVSALPGDFDFDGDVDGRDFLVWQRGGSPTPLGAADLAAWQANYGAMLAAVSTAIPEPEALMLVSAAIMMLGGLPRRSREFD